MTVPLSLAAIAAQCKADSERWWPATTNDAVYHTVALAGEVGEFANELKKYMRGSIGWVDSQPNLHEELTDVFIYLMNLVSLLEFDLEDAYQRKRKVCEERWGSLAKTEV